MKYRKYLLIYLSDRSIKLSHFSFLGHHVHCVSVFICLYSHFHQLFAELKYIWIMVVYQSFCVIWVFVVGLDIRTLYYFLKEAWLTQFIWQVIKACLSLTFQWSTTNSMNMWKLSSWCIIYWEEIRPNMTTVKSLQSL